MTRPYVQTCTGPCGQTRPMGRFPKRGDGRARVCLECTRERRRKRSETERRADRDARLRQRYGITVDEYDRMVRRQRGMCAICRRPPYPRGSRLVVDHDHACGTVRGLLCSPCNSALGLMGDKPDRLEDAALYLSAHADLRTQVT